MDIRAFAEPILLVYRGNATEEVVVDVSRYLAPEVTMVLISMCYYDHKTEKEATAAMATRFRLGEQCVRYKVRDARDHVTILLTGVVHEKDQIHA